jgi:putative ATPase
MLEAGEDPEFIGRRMIILASEDIGLADPQALNQAVAAFQALQVVGLPEASFALSQAVIYLAAAPKSNAVTSAMGRARQAVANNPSAEVPAHLRDAHYSGAARLGHGTSYDYPHDHPDHHVDQRYLPESFSGDRIYEPSTQGDEPEIAGRMAKRGQLAPDPEPDPGR